MRSLVFVAFVGVMTASARADAAADSLVPVVTAVSVAVLGLGLLYAALLAYRWSRSVPIEEEPETDFTPPDSTAFDVQLMDIVRMPDDLTLYFLRLGDRALLVARLQDHIAGLGDFPLGWTGRVPSRTNHPAQPHPSPSPQRPAYGSPTRRDQVEWERQRLALIEALQREEE